MGSPSCTIRMVFAVKRMSKNEKFYVETGFNSVYNERNRFHSKGRRD
jgi:hypothetical protein